MEDWREVEARTMGRAALEDRLGRGRVGRHSGMKGIYGACDEEVRRNDDGVEVWRRLILAGPLGGRAFKTTTHTPYYQHL